MALATQNIKKQIFDFSAPNNLKTQTSKRKIISDCVNSNTFKNENAILKPRPPQILIVDDNDILLNVHAIFLQHLNCDVSTSETGQTALSNFTEYDLIFLDIGLPDTNGIEICKKIRDSELLDKKSKSIPIIALTAYGDEIRKQCLEAGFNDFATKPIDPKFFEQFLIKWLPDHLTRFVVFNDT